VTQQEAETPHHPPIKRLSPSAAIRSRFGGEYVITGVQPTAYPEQAKNDPRLKEVFRDK